jgi:hypothetical protein
MRICFVLPGTSGTHRMTSSKPGMTLDGSD